MRTGGVGLGAACICALSLCVSASGGAASAQAPPDIDRLLSRIAERVAEFYRHAQSVMCVERSTVQPVRADWTADGLARTVESDLRVQLDAPDGPGWPEPTILREVKRINGRAPRERDAKSRFGCTDPNPLSPEPLAFLLPSHRDEFRFTSVRSGREDDRDALIIAFQTAERRSRAELIEDEHGHDDCFDWKGPVARSGRVWVDAATYDVLKVESRLDGPVDIRVPLKLQRRYAFAPYITLDRDDLTLRYRSVRFSEPDERLLLPERIDAMTVLRADLQSIRRTAIFSDYRRFLTSSHIKRTGS